MAFVALSSKIDVFRGFTDVKAGKIDATSSSILSFEKIAGIGLGVVDGGNVVTSWVRRLNGGVLEINFRLTTLGVVFGFSLDVIIGATVVVEMATVEDLKGNGFRFRTATRDGILLRDGASGFST